MQSCWVWVTVGVGLLLPSGVTVLCSCCWQRPRAGPGAAACRWQCLHGAGAWCRAVPRAGKMKGAPPEGTPTLLQCPGLCKDP